MVRSPAGIPAARGSIGLPSEEDDAEGEADGEVALHIDGVRWANVDVS